MVGAWRCIGVVGRRAARREEGVVVSKLGGRMVG